MKYEVELNASNLPVKQTPWGKPDGGYKLADGITQLYTSGHGGIHLDRKRNAGMPDYFRAECASGAFYEEDCCWCVVAIAYPEAFDEKAQQAAKDTLRNWFPDLYERHYGVTLAPGESHKRDEEIFEKASADKFTVRTAWGDWEETTPKGFVKVFARRKTDGAGKYFLIPQAEYVNPSRLICDGYEETSPAKGGSKSKAA